MQSSLSILALVAIGLDLSIAQPTIRHMHLHEQKRNPNPVDWSDPSLYKGVDWSTVNYGNGGGSKPASSPAEIAAPEQAAPSPVVPSPSPTAVVVQQKADAAPVAVSSTTPASSQPSKDAGTDVATSTTSAGSGGKKRGLCYNPTSPDLSMFSPYDTISWANNWGSSRGDLPSQYEFVPTLWSAAEEHTKDWDANVKTALSGSGTKHLMSFNEPDHPDQARMSVASAVAAFGQYMTPYASDDVKLGSPAITAGKGPNPVTGIPWGLDWLGPFLEQCHDCPISFVPLHWYGCQDNCPVDSDIQWFKIHVQDVIKAAGGRPVWVTEFQSFTDPEAFLSDVIPWLESQSEVERYSYFMVSDGILASGNSLSALGKTYMTA